MEPKIETQTEKVVEKKKKKKSHSKSKVDKSPKPKIDWKSKLDQMEMANDDLTDRDEEETKNYGQKSVFFLYLKLFL